MAVLNDILDAFTKTAAGTNAGATATQAAKAGITWCITLVVACSDTATNLTVTAGATSFVVKLQANVPLVIPLPAQSPIADPTFTVNQAVSAAIAGSTSQCNVTIVGYGLSRN